MKLVIGEQVVQDQTVHVALTLSERNLLSLLSKLYTEDSARTLTSGDVTDLYGHPDDPTYIEFAVTAETDAVHYKDREYLPGRMHPRTQEILELIQTRLGTTED